MRYRIGRLMLIVWGALMVLALLFLTPGPMLGANRAVFAKVFSGATAAAASNPVPNIGQSMHLVTVVFPAESAAVTGLQIRIEASFDRTLWFPISSDITAAPAIGGKVYQMEKAFGPWPYVRVRHLQPTTKAMDVYYAGHLIPTVSAITQDVDRFIL